MPHGGEGKGPEAVGDMGYCASGSSRIPTVSSFAFTRLQHFLLFGKASVAPCNTNPAQAPSSVNKYGCGSYDHPPLSALSLIFFQDYRSENASDDSERVVLISWLWDRLRLIVLPWMRSCGAWGEYIWQLRAWATGPGIGVRVGPKVYSFHFGPIKRE